MASAPTPADLELAAQTASRPLPWLDGAARDRLAQIHWADGVVEEGGQFHRVLVVPGQAVLRMTRGPQAAGLLPRRLALVEALSAQRLPLALPRALTEVTSNRAGTAAVVQDYLPGTAHPPHSGDVLVLRELCRLLAGVDVEPLRPHLAEPFAFRGPWTAEKTSAVGLLPKVLGDRWPDWFRAALPESWVDTVEALTGTALRWTEDPVVEPVLVHGDLAGHNMRWAPVGSPAVRELLDREGPDVQRLGLPGTELGEDRGDGRDAGPASASASSASDWVLLGVLDWDLACCWDPALNAAYLSLWHGEEKLEGIARDAVEARRGRVWLGVMALESLYDASLREGTPSSANWGRLLRKTLPRIGRAVEALQDW